MEKNRVIKFGATGENTAVVSEEEVSHESEEFKAANLLLRRVGKIAGASLKGWEYMGSAAVHYFRKDASFVGEKSYTSACQVTLNEGIEEGHADQGWKSLRDALMKSFGHTLPEVRK